MLVFNNLSHLNCFTAIVKISMRYRYFYYDQMATFISVWYINLSIYRDYVIDMHRLNRYGTAKKLAYEQGHVTDKYSVPPAHQTISGGIERSHHYTLLRTPLIVPRDRWSTTPLLRTRPRWSELPRSCAAVAKKRSQKRREKSPLERNRGILAPARREVALSL